MNLPNPVRRPWPVQAGELRVADAGESLVAIGVGSCVIVALYDESTGIGGMLHALLPRPMGVDRDGRPARFASTAVEQLIAEMTARGARLETIRAWVAGGASMLPAFREPRGPSVGRSNLTAARAALRHAGIEIVGEAVGGEGSRSVFLHTGTGRVVVSAPAGPDLEI